MATFFSLDFDDASSEDVTLPSGVDPSGAFTIEAWFKADDFSATHSIISFGDTASNTPIIVLETTSGSKLNGVSRNGDSEVAVITGGTGLSTDTWYHATFVSSASNAYELFLGTVTPDDDASEGTSTTDVDPFPVLNTFRIGSLLRTSPGNFMDGHITLVRIWDDARTLTELNDNKLSQLTGAEAGAVAIYGFRDGSGTNLDDLTSNGYDGTLNNTPAWSSDTPFVGVIDALGNFLPLL